MVIPISSHLCVNPKDSNGMTRESFVFGAARQGKYLAHILKMKWANQMLSSHIPFFQSMFQTNGSENKHQPCVLIEITGMWVLIFLWAGLVQLRLSLECGADYEGLNSWDPTGKRCTLATYWVLKKQGQGSFFPPAVLFEFHWLMLCAPFYSGAAF